MARHRTKDAGRIVHTSAAAGHTARALPADRPRWTRFRIDVAIFAIALLVRVVYLCESTDSPTFRIPIVDSRTYDELARSVAEGRGMDRGFFWQPFFYPFFLSIVYSLSHCSVLAARIIQVLLGSVTCTLTSRLGERIFDRRTGVVAGLLTALCGPLLFLEAELVAAGWAAFWSVVLLLLLMKIGATGNRWLCLLLGICGALAILTRPTFVPFFAAACLWLLVTLRRSLPGWKPAAQRLLPLAAGFVLIATPVAVLRWHLTGRIGIMPSSGGINLYVGNNPESSRLVTLRPGEEWDELAHIPAQQGITDMWDQQDFFYRKTMDYARAEPLAFVHGLAHKAVQYVSSREIPRNIDIYLYRRWSVILDVLAWKIGNFGFPFGVILPLAILGLAYSWRRVPLPLLLFLLLYPLSIILVFVASRYRVPILPAMCTLAAAGALAVIQAVRQRHGLRLAVMAAMIVPIAAVSSLPGPFPEERQAFEAEMYFGVAYRQISIGRMDEATPYLREGLRLDPDNVNAHMNLGNLLLISRQTDEAIDQYNAVLELQRASASPNKNLSVSTHESLAQAFSSQRKFDQAIAQYQAALELAPDNAQLHSGLGWSLLFTRAADPAAAEFRKAIELDSRLVKAHLGLGAVLRVQGHRDEAVAQYQEVLRLDPRNTDARKELDALLPPGDRP